MVATQPSTEQIWQWLAEIPDPEVPAVSIIDLGIVRDVQWTANECVITVTPTYSGCPATEVIARQIQESLSEHGIVQQIKLQIQLAPAWTTDWMTATGIEKLRTYGIAPPPQLVDIELPLACPVCGSSNTRRISQFGSTPCKALHVCNECLEPFDHFKAH